MREIAAPDLSRLTTLRLGGKAQAEIILESLDDLAILPQTLKKWGGNPFCIGAGSNLLARDGDLPITLIRPAFGKKIRILGKKDGKIHVRTDADTPMPRLLRFCLANELSGLEGLCGIPGVAGGACSMNAGSFGVETGDHLVDMLVYQENRTVRLDADSLQKTYRKINFARNSAFAVILEVTFALTQSLKSVIFTRMNQHFFEKKSRQPLQAWSAGCAFKNPPGETSAAVLLEKAGFRGKEAGGMAFSQKHANFLINTGKGSAKAAFDLLDKAQDAVKNRFGVTLEPEIIFLPEAAQ